MLFSCALGNRPLCNQLISKMPHLLLGNTRWMPCRISRCLSWRASPSGVCHPIPPPNLASVFTEYSKSMWIQHDWPLSSWNAFINSLEIRRQCLQMLPNSLTYEWWTCSKFWYLALCSSSSILWAQRATNGIGRKHQKPVTLKPRDFWPRGRQDKSLPLLCIPSPPPPPSQGRFVDLNDLLTYS